jgi:hypothetical protein
MKCLWKAKFFLIHFAGYLVYFDEVGWRFRVSRQTGNLGNHSNDSIDIRSLSRFYVSVRLLVIIKICPLYGVS